MDKNKVLRLHSAFSIKNDASSDSSVYIEGYASTNDVDRHGDVVPSSVWEKGIQNYLRNPVILAYHGAELSVKLSILVDELIKCP